MTLVAQVSVPAAVFDRPPARRLRRAWERRRRISPTMPGLTGDEESLRFLRELTDALVESGFGRPRNRAGTMGGRYCLQHTARRDEVILTVAAPDPRFTRSLHGFLREYLWRREGHSEREVRIRELAREVEEPLAGVRRSVMAALARGRRLEELETAVGLIEPGATFAETATRKVLDLSAAAETAADLLRNGLLDAPAALARFSPAHPLRETELERVEGALHPDTGEPVEILFLDGASTRHHEISAAFLRPCLATWRPDSPDLVGTLAMGRDPANDRWYAVREAPPGATLDRVVAREGRLPAGPAISVLGSAALSLSRLHSRNLVHGDVRPGNLHRDRDGRIRLTGFGRAAAIGSHVACGAEDDPALRAPEGRRRGRADPRQDVYGLAATMLRIADTSEMSEPIRRVLVRATAADPGERHRSGRELMRDLRAALD